MTAPILIGVAAIGVGWAAIVKARNEAPQAPTESAPTMPGAPVESPHPIGANVANTELIGALSASPNAVVYGDPGVVGATQPISVQQPSAEGGFRLPSTSTSTDAAGGNGAPDPSTQPSDGGPEPSVQPSTPVPTGGVLASEPTPTPLDTTTIYYGTSDGLTRSQISQALTEVGSKVGLVW